MLHTYRAVPKNLVHPFKLIVGCEDSLIKQIYFQPNLNRFTGQKMGVAEFFIKLYLCAIMRHIATKFGRPSYDEL